MPRGDTQALNHPQLGSAIRVQSIINRASVAKIKQNLREKNLRDYCLFTLEINTAYRASELLSLTVGQVAHLQVGDLLDIKQKKTKRYRAATLNRNAVESLQVLQVWLAVHPARGNNDAPLFTSQIGRKALCVPSVARLVKSWCRDAGLSGHYGSHTLRKTWGYHQRTENNVPTPLLMMAFGHKTEAQTLDYLHIQEGEIRNLFLELEL